MRLYGSFSRHASRIALDGETALKRAGPRRLRNLGSRSLLRRSFTIRMRQKHETLRQTARKPNAEGLDRRFRRIYSVEALLSTAGDGSCRPGPVAICHPLRKVGNILRWPHIAPCRDPRICA